MSAQVKSHAKKAGKIAGIALFIFFMFFSIKFSVSDSSNGDVDLFGLKVSVFTPSAYATSSYCYKWYPPPTYCYWPPVSNCMCDIIVTP